MQIDSRIATTLAVAALTLLAAAPAGAANTSRALDRALDEVMDERGSPPGLSVLMQRGGKVDFRRRGVADVKADAPMRSRQHYRIASMAKAFNGAVALGLASDGKLKLNDTIGEWIPGLLPKAEKVTISQALQHTAGLPDYIRDDDFIAVLTKDPAQFLTPRELLAFVENKDLEFKPGSEYGYSDTDNVAVGLIAEKASGKSYEQLLKEYVYRPAGLRRTSLPRTVKMPKPYVHGYDLPKGEKPDDVSELINPALAWASGGIVSTARDVNKFFRAYVGGDLFSRKVAKSQNDFVTGSSLPPGREGTRRPSGSSATRPAAGRSTGTRAPTPATGCSRPRPANGKRSIVFTVNSQIVPGQGSQEVSDLIRHAQEDAVCHLLR